MFHIYFREFILIYKCDFLKRKSLARILNTYNLIDILIKRLINGKPNYE